MKILGITIPTIRLRATSVKVREIKDAETFRIIDAEMQRDSKTMTFFEWKRKWTGVYIDPSLLGEVNKSLKQKGYDTTSLERRMSERE